MINNVQVLRGFAAFLVLLAHSVGYNERLLDPIFGVGTRGVDLFFVISGFVMVLTTSKRPVTPVQFLLNRAIRIVPLYWILTLAVFAIALVAPQLLKATRADYGELVKSLCSSRSRKATG